ncbi:iron complex transport system permease protein [Kroppenstedtia eburnea]|uniref:Iron complex transport system permease protein n=2 Tax=Kroppenstedtia eburnea TaxID=714067 RepID=A0A1N7KQB5_9BACL|nr:iron ABC transporter permease [Kroppenstedtia eburnea]SIS63799.1 iron complex transport system permease protein [Kroppenstedtia eburnea]
MLFALIVFTTVIGMGWGTASLSYDRLLPTLIGQGSFKEEFILFSIRLPRLLITLLAGMALALSGGVLQSVARNDLADPGMIGINSGAGVAIAVFFLFSPLEVGNFVYAIPFIAFVGALVTASLIYVLAYERRTGLQPIRLILIGVGLSTTLSGAMIILISSAEREKVDFIAKWLAGSVWGVDWPFVWAILPWLLILIPFVWIKSNQLNLLSMDEPVAIGVGLQMNRERLLLLLAAVALAAAATSVTGGIAFVGLMAPHLAKAVIGHRTQLYLPLCLLLGGWLLLVADTIGRNMVAPEGIPAGVIVSMIGAPYFIYLLFKRTNRWGEG